MLLLRHFNTFSFNKNSRFETITNKKIELNLALGFLLQRDKDKL